MIEGKCYYKFCSVKKIKVIDINVLLGRVADIRETGCYIEDFFLKVKKCLENKTGKKVEDNLGWFCKVMGVV